MIDADDINNQLTDKFSILNIDIAKCYNLVYNKNNLDEISDLCVFGAILSCNYLEDIESILERGLLFMSNKEKEKFVNDTKDAANNKDTMKAVKLENSLDERIKWIEAIATRNAMEKGIQEGIEKGIQEGIKETTNKIIIEMLKRKISPEEIADITEVTIEEIKIIEKEIHKS